MISASAAPFLFLVEDLSEDKTGQPYQTGVSTGDRLERDRPELYRACVELLKRGAGIREIKRITGLHHRTITAVQIAQGSSIDTARKELGARALMVAGLGLERLEEVIADGSIKPGELAMTVGILIDKGQVLTGGVTARVESVSKHDLAAGLSEMLAALPSADAKEIPSTGLVGGNVALIGELVCPDQRDLDGQIADGLPPVDSISTVSGGFDSVDTDHSTALVTDRSPQPDPSTGGGEGVPSESGPESLD